MSHSWSVSLKFNYSRNQPRNTTHLYRPKRLSTACCAQCVFYCVDKVHRNKKTCLNCQCLEQKKKSYRESLLGRKSDFLFDSFFFYYFFQYYAQWHYCVDPLFECYEILYTTCPFWSIFHVCVLLVLTRLNWFRCNCEIMYYIVFISVLPSFENYIPEKKR